MKTKQLHIEEPCHQDWEQMRGDERRRFCAQCDKHVHNLSAMTKAQAQALLERDPELCVIYQYDEHEELVFAPEPTRQQLQLQGARKLLAAAALAVPMMLAACDEPSPQAQPVVTSPITLEESGARLASPAILTREVTSTQGASRAPAPPPMQPTVQTKPELREMTGQATVQLPTPDQEHEREEGEEEVSCDGADQGARSPQAQQLKQEALQKLQKPQERLQNKPLRKILGRPRPR